MPLDFSSVRRDSLLGRLIRWPLGLIPAAATMRIVQGPLRGMRWIAGSSTHGCWLGSYEQDKQREIARTVTPGAVAYDVGANVGYYTLLFSRLVGPGGSVVAFEPVPRNLQYLHAHVTANGLRNVQVIDAAVSDTSGELYFDDLGDSRMGRLTKEGRLRVQAVTLDGLVESGAIPLPRFMKIDVEGAEAAVLRGASEILDTARPAIWLATHGYAARTACLAILAEHDYQVDHLDSDANEFVARPR